MSRAGFHAWALRNAKSRAAATPADREIRLLLDEDDLEVDEIVGPFVARPVADPGAGVELLGDLVVDGEHGDRRGRRQAERLEEVDDVVGDPVLGLRGAADLVVPDLEVDREPIGPCTRARP